jgi:hypothetical protein
MLLIGLGAACIVAGVLLMALQPMQRRMSGGRNAAQPETVVINKTLEPSKPASGFGLRSNWPGLALVGLGGACLLAGAAI